MQLRSVAWALGVSMLALDATAEVGAGNGVRLSFVRTESAVDCITASTLETQIARRMGRNPFAGAAKQWIEGVVQRQADSYDVELFERDAEGRTLGRRHLREKTADCHLLDDAIVLAIALIIDPTAELAPATPVRTAAPMTSQASASDALAAATSVDAGRAQDARHSALVHDERRNAPRPDAVRRDAPTQKPTANTKAAMVSASAILVGGVLPGAAPGVELITNLPINSTRSAAMRLTALYLPEKRQYDPDRDLGYGLTALHADVCAQRPGRLVGWYGCAGLGLGAVHVVVHNPAPLEPGDRLWFTGRLEVGANLHLAGPFWLQTRLFDLLTPAPWRFRVVMDDKPVVAFEQSAFMPGAALGLGLQID